MNRQPGGRMGLIPAFTALTLAALASTSGAADGPPLERVQTIALKGPIGGMDHLALDAKRGRLFVANTVNGTLDVIDLKSGKLFKQVPGQGKIRGVAYAPDIDRVFVGNGAGGVCNVLDGEDYRVLKGFPLGDDVDTVRYNPKTRRAYVVHADEELAVIDVKDYALRSPIPLPKSLGAFQLEASRPRMYINAKAAGQVVVIDTDKDTVIDRFPVAPAGVNAALAIDEPNRRLFVGCRRNPSLVVLDSNTGKIVASVPIPGDVDDVFFDPQQRRIIATCGDGAIAVIRQVDADRYEPLATITTVAGARTSYLDPEGGLLFVAVPRRGERPEQVSPEVWVYRLRP
jgi:DNA-binding beta-propeller fold protein YncE